MRRGRDLVDYNNHLSQSAFIFCAKSSSSMFYKSFSSQRDSWTLAWFCRRILLWLQWTFVNYRIIHCIFIARYDFAVLILCFTNENDAITLFTLRNGMMTILFVFFADKYKWLSRTRQISSEDNINFSYFRSVSHVRCSQHRRNRCLPWK